MKKIVSALLISAAAVSAPAFAEGFMDGVVGSKYIAADLGQISYNGNSATAIDVGFGYQVHPAVAVEVGYLHGGTYTTTSSFTFFGTTTTTSADESLSALQVMAVGHYNFGNGWGVYAKAGIEHNMAKASYVQTTTGLPAISASATNATNDIAYGIGGTYDVTNTIKLRAQYMETGVSSVNTLSIGAQFAF